MGLSKLVWQFQALQRNTNLCNWVWNCKFGQIILVHKVVQNVGSSTSALDKQPNPTPVILHTYKYIFFYNERIPLQLYICVVRMYVCPYVCPYVRMYIAVFSYCFPCLRGFHVHLCAHAMTNKSLSSPFNRLRISRPGTCMHLPYSG